MQQVLDNCEDRMKKSISALETDYLALRTGRASAAIFDKIRVDYYGQETPLNQVASVSVPEARLVVIQPWDKSLLGMIEKAIQKSDLGLNPSNDGTSLPSLRTGERNWPSSPRPLPRTAGLQSAISDATAWRKSRNSRKPAPFQRMSRKKAKQSFRK